MGGNTSQPEEKDQQSKTSEENVVQNKTKDEQQKENQNQEKNQQLQQQSSNDQRVGQNNKIQEKCEIELIFEKNIYLYDNSQQFQQSDHSKVLKGKRKSDQKQFIIKQYSKYQKREDQFYVKLKNLKQESLVQIEEFFFDKDDIFFVVEEPHQQVDWSELSNSLNMNEKINLFLKISLTVQKIHQLEMIHYNITPEAFQVLNQQVKLSLSHSTLILLKKGQLSNDSKEVKTQFKAPELMLNKKFDHRIDIWMLGVTVFKLFFNEYPFQKSGSSPDDIKWYYDQVQMISKQNNFKYEIYQQENKKIFEKLNSVPFYLLDLFRMMFQYEFEERINIDGVISILKQSQTN